MTSFIDDIQKITDNQEEFIVNSNEDNTNSLAAYLPNGKLYQAKNIDGTLLRNSLSSIARELSRKETKLKEIADDYYPYTTISLLERWEQALKIPDDCFSVENVSIEQRQKQVIAKLVIDTIINKDDFIALAKFFGYTIQIATGFDADVFPAIFPMTLGGGTKEEKFTMIVTFSGITPPAGFPYVFPFTFEDNPATLFIECLIRKLSPANVNVVFKYTP